MADYTISFAYYYNSTTSTGQEITIVFQKIDLMKVEINLRMDFKARLSPDYEYLTNKWKGTGHE